MGVRVRVRCSGAVASVPRVPLSADLHCCGRLSAARRRLREAPRFGVRGLQRKPVGRPSCPCSLFPQLPPPKRPTKAEENTGSVHSDHG